MPKHQLFSSTQSEDYLNLSLNDGKQGKKDGKQSLKKSQVEPATSTPDTSKKKRKITDMLEIQSASDSESDSMSDHDFFCGPHNFANKLPYSLEEDEVILRFLFKGRNIFKASSISLWKYLESKKENPKRTYQSLKNRFLKNIKPNLFSTYKYLITSEEIVQNILMKYPELKKNFQISNQKPSLNFPKRPLQQPRTTEENVVSSTSAPPQSENNTAIEGSNTKKVDGNKFRKAKKYDFDKWRPIAIINNKENSYKKVQYEDDSIVITIQVNKKTKKGSSSSQVMGIYEKYLKNVEKNTIKPCSYCGRGDPKLMVVDENSFEEESDNFIRCSVDSTKKSCTKNVAPAVNSENAENLNSQRSSSRKSTPRKCRIKNTSVSPSMLDEVTRTNDVDQSPAVYSDKIENNQKVTVNSNASAVDSSVNGDFTQNSKSKETPNDSDVNSLFEETIAECRNFMDSDEEDKLVNEYFKRNYGKLGFEPIISNCKNSGKYLDSFFTEKDSSYSESTPSSSEFVTQGTSCKSVEKVMKNLKKAPLAKNMVKMLSDNKYVN